MIIISKNKNDFLEKLFLENYADMLSLTSRFIRNEDIAQDVVQQTFLVAQVNLDDKLINSPNPVGWLYNTLKNIIGDAYRKRNRLMSMTTPIEFVEEQSFASIDSISIRVKYEGIIGKEDLNLLIWVYCEDVPYAVAAERLNINLDACKKRIQRAKLRLKEALEK